MKFCFCKILVFTSLVLACSPKKETNATPLLAEVGDKKLYLSDIEDLVNSSSPEDSLRILKGLVNNWIQDRLMVLEAEKNMPTDINLNKMVEEYKESLVLYNYETKLTAEILDTAIQNEERQKYYNSHHDDFVLSESIGKYVFAKFSTKTKDLDDFYKKWKATENYESLNEYCKKYAEFSDLDHTQWKTISQLESYLPKNIVSRSILDDESSIRKKDKEFEYLIKVFEYADGETKPPFDYLKTKIDKIILNDRKSNLLKKKKMQIYAKEGSGNKVKIYVK